VKALDYEAMEWRTRMLRDIVTITVQGANLTAMTPFSLFEPREGKDKQGNTLFKTIKGTLPRMYRRQ
jgi:hypothetical protein